MLAKEPCNEYVGANIPGNPRVEPSRPRAAPAAGPSVAADVAAAVASDSPAGDSAPLAGCFSAGCCWEAVAELGPCWVEPEDELDQKEPPEPRRRFCPNSAGAVLGPVAAVAAVGPLPL